MLSYDFGVIDVKVCATPVSFLLFCFGDAAYTQEGQVFFLLGGERGFEDFIDFDVLNVFSQSAHKVSNHMCSH